jgi:alkylated DNA repair dioxygenase AlkB
MSDHIDRGWGVEMCMDVFRCGGESRVSAWGVWVLSTGSVYVLSGRSKKAGPIPVIAVM